MTAQQEHIARLFAQREAAEARLRAIDAKLDAACRAYSTAKGYRVPLRRESVLAEVRAHG